MGRRERNGVNCVTGEEIYKNEFTYIGHMNVPTNRCRFYIHCHIYVKITYTLHICSQSTLWFCIYVTYMWHICEPMKHMSHIPHIYVDLVRVTLPYMSHIIGVLNCSLQNKAHCKPHCCSWEDIPHVHFHGRSCNSRCLSLHRRQFSIDMLCIMG